MKHLAGVLFFAAIGAVQAAAATVTNGDGAPVVVVVVEDGNRMEIAIDAGATETLCPSGCFVTLPNGDRLGLDGGEHVDIVHGAAVVK